jgi:hypothetical protein
MTIPLDSDNEPFLLRQRTEEEIADYDKGFESGQKGGPNDDTKSEAWQRGWAEAQEWAVDSEGEGMATITVTCVNCARTETVEDTSLNRRDHKCSKCGESMIVKRHPGNSKNC